ncbi:MAG: hypothetical protein K2P34_10975, partial [Lachnospiraceae bacterium]|nr:hypothetical protein [Lachnospiraceae bacterium]
PPPFFFFKHNTAYALLRCLVGSEIFIRDRGRTVLNQRSSPELAPWNTVWGNRSIQTKRQIIKVIESICFIDIRSFGVSL